jgi:hypothetical protein
MSQEVISSKRGLAAEMVGIDIVLLTFLFGFFGNPSTFARIWTYISGASLLTSTFGFVLAVLYYQNAMELAARSQSDSAQQDASSGDKVFLASLFALLLQPAILCLIVGAVPLAGLGFILWVSLSLYVLFRREQQ